MSDDRDTRALPLGPEHAADVTRVDVGAADGDHTARSDSPHMSLASLDALPTDIKGRLTSSAVPTVINVLVPPRVEQVTPHALPRGSAAPEEATQAPRRQPEPEPVVPVLATPTAPAKPALRSALLGLGALLIAAPLLWWTMTPDAPAPSEELRIELAHSLETAGTQADAAPPSDTPAPPLAAAAVLVCAGRWDEAANAYEALARAHPDRHELAAMARVLRAKARRSTP